jgi:hypothetical protein
LQSRLVFGELMRKPCAFGGVARFHIVAAVRSKPLHQMLFKAIQKLCNQIGCCITFKLVRELDGSSSTPTTAKTAAFDQRAGPANNGLQSLSRMPLPVRRQETD